MCLAVPIRIESIDGAAAVGSYRGGEYRMRLDLVDADVGDYVLVHAGIAISKLDPDEARETLQIFDRLDEANRSLSQPPGDREPGRRDPT